MEIRKIKNGAKVTLQGWEQVVLWLWWISKDTKRSKLKPDDKFIKKKERFEKRHNIKFFYKKGADMNEFSFRFGRKWCE